MYKLHELLDFNPIGALASKRDHRHPVRWLGGAIWFTLLQFGLGTGFFYVGRNVLDEEIPVDTLFAGLTLLLGLFVPVAMDRHRSLMEAYYAVAKNRNTLVRVLNQVNAEAPKAKKDAQSNVPKAVSSNVKEQLRTRVMQWIDTSRQEGPMDSSDVQDIDGWTSSEDYVQEAISQLFDSIYTLRSTKKWNVENTYPDLLALSLLLYFGVFNPLFQHQGTYAVFVVELIFTALFCNIIFMMARRDILSFDKEESSQEYKTLEQLGLKDEPVGVAGGFQNPLSGIGQKPSAYRGVSLKLHTF